MNSRAVHLTQLLFAVFVMSSSGPLGRFLSLPVPVSIWIRSVLAATVLFLILKITKQPLIRIKRQDFLVVVLTAIFLGLHWVAYFWALQYSGVAVGMLAMFTYPVMTALLEPLFFRSTVDIRSTLLALIGFVGVYFLVPEFTFKNQVTVGILSGLLSALVYALRNMLSKKLVSAYSGTTLMMYQSGIISLLMLPVVYFYSFNSLVVTWQIEWPFVVLLGLYTTAVGHTLLVKSFSHFPITTLSIITCLMPLMGIIQGYFFLNEKPTYRILIGGGIILFSVIIESFRMLKKNN